MSVLKYVLLIYFLNIFSRISGKTTTRRYQYTVPELFKIHHIVPKVIRTAPPKRLEVKYPSGREVWFGNRLTPRQTVQAPSLSFESTPGQLYTVIMVDVDYRLHHAGVLHINGRHHGVWRPPGMSFHNEPWMARNPDASSHDNPSKRHWLHWLVGNLDPFSIQGFDKATIMADYIGPTPPPGSGTHRYVLLVYQQHAAISFDEIWKEAEDNAKRSQFNLKAFVEKYNLGDPIAGNFFYSSKE